MDSILKLAWPNFVPRKVADLGMGVGGPLRHASEDVHKALLFVAWEVHTEVQQCRCDRGHNQRLSGKQKCLEGSAL